MLKIWSNTSSASGSYGRQVGSPADSQSDKILVDSKNFKILYQSHY